MSKALDNLKNYVAETQPSENKEIEETTGEDKSSSLDAKSKETNIKSNDFNVKSLDFIEDKMIRGIAKKSFMAAKRAKSDVNTSIDMIIKDLDSNSKLDEDIRVALLNFKIDNSKEETNDDSKDEIVADDKTKPLFDIKLLNDIEDKMIRGSAKKIYMAGKRANKNSDDVIKDILDELSDKLDDNSKSIIEGLK